MFNIGDKVEIVCAICGSEDMQKVLSRYIGYKGEITKIRKQDMFGTDITWYIVSRIPYLWKEEELRLVEYNISMTEKELLSCFNEQ